MICPNINIKEVFDGFNEMVEALGGKPMTEEEFKSGELRNKRTGLDYSAMEAAYKLYHRNGGNFLDLAPNGKTSILFQTLLSEFGGDRTKAIKAKSAVYSNRFREWFGDWLQEDKTDVSKVVDENGEPLVVYHGTSKEFDTFDSSKNDKAYKGFFFTDSKVMSSSYGKIAVPVFLNIKNSYNYDFKNKNWNNGNINVIANNDDVLDKIRIHKNQMLQLLNDKKIDNETFDFWDKKYYSNLEKYNNLGDNILDKIKKILLLHKLKKFSPNIIVGSTTREIERLVELEDETNIIFNNIVDFGGVYSKEAAEEIIKRVPHTVYVTTNPNQIKSATGNIEIEKPGTGFSTTNNNIYKRENRSVSFLSTASLISPASIYDVVYPDIAASLLDGDIVSSKDVIEAMISNDVFNGHNRMLADILQKHDIPVKIDNSLGIGTLAETVTDNKGNAVILINGNLLSGVSKSFLGTTILHEMIHAVTVNAIDNPQTKEQKSFVKANKNIFKTLKKAFKGREYLFNNTEYGLYALTNEKEFAAEFMTDDGVRNLMYQIARELDKSGGVIQMLKDFVNAVSNLLINRSVFASNEELLTDYQNKFQSFLEGQETQNTGKFLSKSEIRELCSMNDSELDANEAIINATKELNHFIETAQHNKLISVKKAKSQDEFEKIAERLQTRISAVRTSALPLSKKQAAINNTSKILDMYLKN